MDRFGAVNIRIVLISLILFTLLALLALLWMVVDGDPATEPPELLVGLVGTLLGAITGSTVSITAPRKVRGEGVSADLPAIQGELISAPIPTPTPPPSSESTPLSDDWRDEWDDEEEEPIGDGDRLTER